MSWRGRCSRILPACAGRAVGEFVMGCAEGGAEVAQVCENGSQTRKEDMAEAKGADTEDANSMIWIDEVGTREDGFSREANREKRWGTEQNSRRWTRERRKEGRVGEEGRREGASEGGRGCGRGRLCRRCRDRAWSSSVRSSWSWPSLPSWPMSSSWPSTLSPSRGSTVSKHFFSH